MREEQGRIRECASPRVFRTFCMWFLDEAAVKTEPWLGGKEKGSLRSKASLIGSWYALSFRGHPTFFYWLAANAIAIWQNANRIFEGQGWFTVLAKFFATINVMQIKKKSLYNSDVKHESIFNLIHSTWYNSDKVSNRRKLAIKRHLRIGRC